MPRTIDDKEYDFLQAERRIAAVARSLYDDPKAGNEIKRLLKDKYPEMQIQDYDLEQRIEARLAADRKEREDAENNRRNEEQTTRFNTIRQSTQKKYGFTDEAMEELEKMMVERNVGDYEVAARYMASENPKPSDATFNDGRWNHDKAPGFVEIAKDPEGWGRSEILRSLNQIQERERNQRF